MKSAGRVVRFRMPRYVVRTLIAAALAGFSAPAAQAAAPGTGSADTIFVGGAIVTVNPTAPQVRALAVKGGIIVGLGDEKAVREQWTGTTTQVVDLRGGTLMPGFVEPHVHFIGTAMQTLLALDVSNFELPYDTLDTIVAKLTAHLKTLPPGQWLTAFGVDPSRTIPFMAALTADILDKVSTDVPIFVLNQSGHIAYVNHKALDAAGIGRDTPNPPGGGVYVKDARGNLTGEMLELSSYLRFQAKMPVPTRDEIMAVLMRNARNIAATGITTCAEIALGTAFGFDNEIAMLKALEANPAMPLRLRVYLYGPAVPSGYTVRPGDGDDRLRFVGVKFVADGSNQGLTGALNAPYTYPKGTTNRGTLDYAEADLLGQARPFFDQGWQLSIHANGDRAIDQTLAIYGQLLAGNPDPIKRRLRIEHFTITTEAQVDRVKQLGITPGMTIGHVDFWGQPFHDQIIGPERARRIDPTGSLKKRGVHFAFHSDSPVSPFAPLRYISDGVTRRWQTPPRTVLGPDQRITIDDAIRAVTLDAAYQMFVDDKVGSLEVGKWADFVVLAKNPRTTDPKDIVHIKVLETWLSGVKQSF